MLRNNNHSVLRILFNICVLVSWKQFNLTLLNFDRCFNCFIYLHNRAFILILLVLKIKDRLLGFGVLLLLFFSYDFKQVWAIFLCWNNIIFNCADQLSVMVSHNRFVLRWQFVALDKIETNLRRSRFLFLSSLSQNSSIRWTFWFRLTLRCFWNINWDHFGFFWFLRRNFEAFACGQFNAELFHPFDHSRVPQDLFNVWSLSVIFDQ